MNTHRRQLVNSHAAVRDQYGCPVEGDGCKRGMTVIELLVVITIVAMLVALLLPAVQAARETARRSLCQNHLRQLCLALHGYESMLGQFPAAGDVARNERFKVPFWGDFVPHEGRQISWVVSVLPFFEQQSLYDRFDLDRSVFEQDRNPASVLPQTLRCPSDAAEGRFVQASFTRHLPLAKGNYAAWVSPYHVDLQRWFMGALGGWGMTLKRVTDGTSKTLMVSEVRTSPSRMDERGAWAVPWNGASLLAYDAHHDLSTGGWSFRVDREKSAHEMQRPNFQGFHDGIYGCDDAETAAAAGMPCANFRNGTVELSAAPRSYHRGGVNVVSMDGAGRFVVDGIDPTLLAYLICVDDGNQRDVP